MLWHSEFSLCNHLEVHGYVVIRGVVGPLLSVISIVRAACSFRCIGFAV